jgi:hypothetical protein
MIKLQIQEMCLALGSTGSSNVMKAPVQGSYKLLNIFIDATLFKETNLCSVKTLHVHTLLVFYSNHWLIKATNRLFQIFCLIQRENNLAPSYVRKRDSRLPLKGIKFNKAYAVLRRYAVYVCSCLTKFRDSLPIPWPLEDTTDVLLRNVGTKLPIYTV